MLGLFGQAKLLYLFSLIVSLTTVVGCNSKQAIPTAIQKPYIVVTTSIVADTIRNIGKDRITVESLMGPGVDPHLYKASPGDISKMNKASLIVYNGLHLEGKMSDVLEKLGRKKNTYAIAAPISKNELIFPSIGESLPDPHIWMDVNLWSQTIKPLAEKLSTIDPENKSYYLQNAAAYQHQLKNLNQKCYQQIQTIPASQRVLITAHDAFRYFGKAYGMKVLGVQGISTESEAGLKEINNLVTLIAKQHIPAVFIESSVSPKNVQALLEGAKNKGEKVRLGGELYSDALGATNTPEGTYIGMIKHNVQTIVEALR